VRAFGKTVSNRERRAVLTERRRHGLHRCKAPGDGADGPACSFGAKAARVRTRLAAFYTKAPAIDVMGNCDGRHLPLSLGKY
jgi:hypothetical protein